MKKILYILLLVATAMGVTSCLGNGVEDTYKDWREANEKWFLGETTKLDDNGHLFYEAIVAPWDPNARVYVHWFNDRSLTEENLSPLYTSTVDVKYIGRVYNGTPFDSTYLSTSPRDSVVRLTLGSGLIEGWGIALPNMHVGDSCRILINYQQGYGTYNKGDIIKPFSALQFDLKLVDIYKYEAKP